MKKNKTKASIFQLSIAFFIFLFAFTHCKNNVAFTHYKNFGISIPDGYSMHGIDISHHEGNINWTLVKNMHIEGIKIKFVFGKATQGLNVIDENYLYNKDQTEKQKLIHGAYHYLSPKLSGVDQAKFFIVNAKLNKGNIIPVLDIEEIGTATEDELKTCVQDWLDTAEEFYDTKPIIYSNAAFYNKYLASYCSKYPLWVAHYTNTNNPNVNKNWMLWQHSENATINGIPDLVDFNVFKGDSLAFIKYILK
jgi:lysozyme